MQATNKIDKIICVFLLFCIIFGSMFTFGDIRVAGMVITLYRLAIPTLAIYYFVKRIMNKSLTFFLENKLYMFYFIFCIFWLIYGTGLLFLSQYVVFADGAKELLDLFLGILISYCILECCCNKQMLVFMLRTIKIFICAICIIAIAEMFIGIHFATSKYYTDWSSVPFIDLIKASMKSNRIYPATVNFFGVNDLSTFLTIFFPLFFVNRDTKKISKVANILVQIMIIFIVAISDANICLVALLISTLFGIILNAKNIFGYGTFVGVVIFQQWLAKVFANLLIWLKGCMAKWAVFATTPIQSDVINETLDESAINYISNLTEVVSAQLHGAEEGYGSLYSRFILIGDAIRMWIDSHLLGIGPAAFPNYIKQNGSKSRYFDPHNYWMEILSQYGVFVFVAYLIALLIIFIKNIKNYIRSHNFTLLRILCVSISFVVASIAPSSFLGYGYQWIVIGLGLATAKMFESGNDIEE